MKTTKITYWVSTAFIALMLAFSTFAYLTDPAIKAGFSHLGFPDYFRIELGIAKLLGAIVILAPIHGRIKEWAYAGVSISFISAFIAHTSSGDPVSAAVTPLVMFGILMLSYFTYHKMRTASGDVAKA